MGVVRQTSAVVRGSVLAEFKRLALALDFDLIALMKRVGIDRRHLDNPDLLLPARAIVELFETAALTSGIEDFGLRIGEARGLPDFGPLVLMLREEESLRDALRTLVSLMHLHSHALYMHLEEGSDPILTLDIMIGDAIQCRQTIDSGVAGLAHILRWLLGEDWNPASVCFKHARPISKARYERFFRCPIDFLHEFNGIVLRARDLDKKLPTSSPVLRRQIERYIKTITVAPSDIYVHRVTQVVAMALPRGEAKASIVARCLGTDRRTLNRRLARGGLNFSAVVEDVRKDLTMQYLRDMDRPLSKIAGLIGFGSLSTFTRWFCQSFDCAPSVWRKVQRSKKSH